MKLHKLNKKDKEYIPRIPEKYCGTYPIICRSSWETKMCIWLDNNNNVLEWSSEGHRIPYFFEGRNRIYYPDFYVMFRSRKKFIVEVKPEKDMRMPKKKKKSQRTMLLREHTFLMNQAKFKAAKRYCKKLGYKFIVITEKDLFRGK
jgi:hypothetical protein